MAVVSPTTQISNDLYSYIAIAASDTTLPLRLEGGWGLVMSVQVLDGGGSGFNSGTFTVQLSNDGTTWFTAKDINGNDVTFTANGGFEMSTGARFIRGSADGSIANVDMYVSFA